jgi:putative alpha-1,2-mannosidase
LFYVPGDVQGLIDLLGGREAFLQRLEKLHSSAVLYMGDEQAFLTAFLYHYAGRPGLSAKMTHRYVPSMFNDTIAGIPGNDDSGAMGTFVLFSMMGIFPSAGQNVYFIIPPYFPSVSITNPQTGKTAKIKNVNFDATYRNVYIQSAKLNGRPYTKNWIDHNFFLHGGTLELVLGETESSWGTRQAGVPPSLSTGLYLG